MGMGGFFMHSRTGLATEYMGPGWLHAIEACAERAEKFGLEAWLYDEDRWPSGAAGGLVTKDPRFRMRYLRCSILTGEDFKWPANESFVAAFAAEIDGIDLKSYRLLPKGKPTLKPGEKILLFTIELVHPHDFFNGAAYLNTIDPVAVRRFLNFTHERYKKSSGRRFGHSIPGIFTDEPHHGFVMCDTSKGWVYPIDSGWATPWDKALPGYFQKRFDYDFCERLPELFFRLHGERFSPVKWHYMEVLHSLFLKNYAKQIGDWCRRNNLLYTGHVLAEDLPGSMSITNGSVLRYYEQMDAPGMDLLNTNDRSFWTAKQVASSARQFGKKWLLSELYGATGWQMGFDGHKEIGDWQAFLGINIRCHHLAWYSMAGESKRDYPASISFQSSWYREYRAIEDYYARINLVMQQGQAACDLLVLHPCESVWAQVYARWATWIKNQSPDIAPIDDNFKLICQWILGSQLDFDYGDEEQLARLARIEKDGGKPQLRLGKARYRAILVGGMETMRSTTLQVLKKFQQAGGKLIFAGNPPAYMDAIRSSAPVILSQKAIRVPLQRGPLVAAIRAAIRPRVEIESASSSDLTRPVLLQVRKDGKAWTIALCNTDPKRELPSVRVKFNGPGAQVQEWDCRTGEQRLLPHRAAGNSLRWNTALGSLGERIFRVTTSPDRTLKAAPLRRKGKIHKARGPFAYELDEPNALPIDQFEWRAGRGRWQASTDILVIDDRLRDQLGLKRRTGAMIQPWARKKSAHRATLPIQLRASFNLRSLPHGPVHLLMEQPGQWKILLNGKPVTISQDDGWFIDPCFRKISFPADALKKGENHLEFSASFHQELDLEAIYLLGTFGVYRADTKRPFIDRLPKIMKLGDVCAQGLPFYTGRIRYLVPISFPTRHLRLPRFGGAVACVRNASGESHVLAFPPYEVALAKASVPESIIAVEVVLTRRNLFGPLHLVPKEQFHTGPPSFRSTVGAYHAGFHKEPAYSVIPELYPSGLLTAPEFEIANGK